MFEEVLKKIDEEIVRIEKIPTCDDCTDTEEIFDEGRKAGWHEEIIRIKEIILSEQQKEQNGWIPVSERLPIGSEYELIDDVGEVLYKHVLCNVKEKNIPLKIGFYQEGDWFSAETYDLLNVVAWMPTPEKFTQPTK